MSDDGDELKWTISDNVPQDQIKMIMRLMESTGGTIREVTWEPPSEMSDDLLERIVAIVERVEFYASLPYPLNERGGPSFTRFDKQTRKLRWDMPMDGVDATQRANVRASIEALGGSVEEDDDRGLTWVVPESVTNAQIDEVMIAMWNATPVTPAQKIAAMIDAVRAAWKESNGS